MKKYNLENIKSFERYFEKEIKNLYNAQISKNYLINFENGKKLSITIERI